VNSKIAFGLVIAGCVFSTGSGGNTAPGTSPQSGVRKSAWVFATEITSKERLECEVFIDLIHRLEILTSTRVINVGDTVSLEVQAFDVHDNVFSSLEGYAVCCCSTSLVAA